MRKHKNGPTRALGWIRVPNGAETKWSSTISFKMVFPSDLQHCPFCKQHRIESTTNNRREDRNFSFTNQETVYYYWMIVFVPSTIIFLSSVAYLVVGE
ncbi:unnamed protein product [Lactuca virosa]|uniref:Uncharacterized protein n=1 Tax=Lactuca virosa TaxID=75947 RepID=A0AAU9MKC6_9ASTR|nr:unnamed protein product [Lactuca virosa]